MQETSELRWFFKRDNSHLQDWLCNLPYQIKENRTDFYLNLLNEDISVNLKNDNLEIKYRTGATACDCLTENISGFYETFIQWSLMSDADDSLVHTLLNRNYKHWIPVQKQSILALLTVENEKLIAKDTISKVTSGCQFEYSIIHIWNVKWFTVGLKCARDKPMEMNSSHFFEIFGTSKLDARQSRGYADFLVNCLYK